MRIGLQIYHFDWPGGFPTIGPRLVEIAKTAERAGFYSLWVMDHFFQLGEGFGPPEITRVEGPMLEGYSTMSYLAAVTQKVKLGLMVTGSIYRYPGILIKTVTTLDVLSGGRAYFGVGTGWNEREARGLGVPFPESTLDLIGRLEETIQIAKHMWSGSTAPFTGKYYRLEEPLNNPQPLSKPHPPIMVGMWKGGRKMLALTAKYADACNLQIGTPLAGFPQYVQERYQTYPDYLTKKLGQLKAYCDQVGRSYDDIERTVLATIRIAPDAQSPADVIHLCENLSKFGIRQVIFNMPDVHTLKPIEIMGEQVIPRLASLI